MAEKSNKQEALQALANQLEAAEASLREIHKMISELGVKPEDLPKPNDKRPAATPAAVGSNAKVIEGRFDGQGMVGPNGKTYPVPANYASKSKLVEGDTLKLTIADDGSFIYKQIGPVERKKLIGKLTLDDGQYKVEAGGTAYNVLFASVTYFKAQPGDEVTVVIPAEGSASWAALEAVIGAE
ncbi:hypothetical protein IT414_03395 [bacterium]|nr:hypothetical protein [bacterium]